MEDSMKIIYRIDLEGKVQLQNDETGTSSVIRKAAKRLGYVITEFTMDIEGEDVEVVALTPDTIMGSQRLEIERLIRSKHKMLKQIKRIKL
jgi:hypothetical protein